MRARVLLPGLATVVVLAVAGCGSDDGGGTAVSTKATPSTASTASTPKAASTPSTASDAASVPAGAKAVSGSGYRTTVPEGWRDLTKTFEGSAIKVDRVYGAADDSAFPPNLVIIRETPQAIAGKDVGEIADQVRTEAASAVGADVPDAEAPTTLGGEDAERWTLRRDAAGQSIAQQQLVAMHDGALYTLTLSAAADDEAGQGVLDDVVAGWDWE
jgi:hypothetical protein